MVVVRLKNCNEGSAAAEPDTPEGGAIQLLHGRKIQDFSVFCRTNRYLSQIEFEIVPFQHDLYVLISHLVVFPPR